MRKRPRFLAVAVAAILVLAGCSKGNKSTSPQFKAATHRLCSTESKVLGVVSDVSSGAISSQSDAISKLKDLQSVLSTASKHFTSHGFADLGSKVKDLSSAVSQLEKAVSGSDSAGIVTAAATIASAIAALPGCPGVTPSAS
jgi:hypothetical protein